MIDEAMLEVDFDNAERDGENLDEPNWQLFANDLRYRILYVSALLAKARNLQCQIESAAEDQRSCNRAAWLSAVGEPMPF